MGVSKLDNVELILVSATGQSPMHGDVADMNGDIVDMRRNKRLGFMIDVLYHLVSDKT